MRRFYETKNYADKIIAALQHPIQDTVIHAALILGERKKHSVVEALAELVMATEDVYVATAGVQALGKIGNPDALAFLETITNHPAQMFRKAVSAILEKEFSVACEHGNKTREEIG